MLATINPLDKTSMMTKILLSSSLIFILASCSQDPVATPAAATPAMEAADATAAVAPAVPTAPIAASAASVEPVATTSAAEQAEGGQASTSEAAGFETVALCVQSGWNKSQCERAWNIAKGAAKTQAPTYTTIDKCKTAWLLCEASEGGQWAPVMAGFFISGEKKGDPTPNPDFPAFYLPVFVTSENKWVHIGGTQEKKTLISIDPGKIAQATKPGA